AGDFDAMTLPQGYDIITAAHSLEHVPDPARTLTRVRKLLNPGGIVILVVSRPHWCSRLVWLNWRHRRFAEAEVRAMLAGAGFADLHCWQPPAGPPRRLSLAYAGRKGRQAECAPSASALTMASTSATGLPAPISFTMAEPTTQPSATEAMLRAASGVLIPKPTITGRSVDRLIRATSGATSVATAAAAPVIPVTET
ncbi:MAG: hypothetical protein B7Y02_18190, partial [Rhodobacterales bacterium 17-64-5]